MIALLAINDYYNVVFFTDWRYKCLQNVFIWSLFILRNLFQYGM